MNPVSFPALVSRTVLIPGGLHGRQYRINLHALREPADIRHGSLHVKIQPCFTRILCQRYRIIDEMQINRDVHIVIGNLLHRLLIIQRNDLQILPVEIGHPKIQVAERNMCKPDPENIILHRLGKPCVIFGVILLHRFFDHLLNAGIHRTEIKRSGDSGRRRHRFGRLRGNIRSPTRRYSLRNGNRRGFRSLFLLFTVIRSARGKCHNYAQQQAQKPASF